MEKRRPMSVLLLDDNPDLVTYYGERLKRYAGLNVTGETNSLRARALAQRQLFDLLVIDAKLEYRGFEFGGLRYGVGVGLHYRTPVGPVNFDFGFKVDPLPGEEPFRFDFSVGIL